MLAGDSMLKSFVYFSFHYKFAYCLILIFKGTTEQHKTRFLCTEIPNTTENILPKTIVFYKKKVK
jgi:hypothetical protein